MKLRPVLYILSVLLAALGALMIFPVLADLIDAGARANPAAAIADRNAFLSSSLLCVFAGVCGALATAGRKFVLSARSGFLIITGGWVLLVSAAALPFAFGPMEMSYTDALFEATSGLTTTGATVVTGLDDAPRGFLLWRAMLQWIGGVGVVIMALAVMPFLSVGGMQLFRLESSDRSEQLLPRASQIAAEISRIYVALSVLCLITYRAGGMDGFDALAHAMTTISTGGFSTHDTSFGHFSGSAFPLDLAAVVFMLTGGLPFGVFMLATRGRWRRMAQDPQVPFFLILVAGAVAFAAPSAAVAEGVSQIEGVRLALFNVVSVMTGTGYATADYGGWGAFAVAGFFCLTFLGACAGSTSCGMKVFRLQIAFAAVRLYARRLTHPHGVKNAFYNGRPLSESDFTSVLSFVFVYFAIFAALAAALGMLGLDPVTALSSAATAIANVGPGLGEIVGPAGNFQTLSDVHWRSDAAKWMLTIGMLLGRLEFFTVLVLLTPRYWRT
ncbi:MAG: TrkH family potassium uptake protein [Pseudomonadota bacterium]